MRTKVRPLRRMERDSAKMSLKWPSSSFLTQPRVRGIRASPSSGIKSVRKRRFWRLTWANSDSRAARRVSKVFMVGKYPSRFGQDRKFISGVYKGDPFGGRVLHGHRRQESKALRECYFESFSWLLPNPDSP